ncbi:hypothetical protein ESA_00129 [Cronobacter sakazakii ATCC BAA-894]|uniref:Uncharacterized protein n=1 Tax=Cronobacter sakazakii (strain ATCC BAA-894) TaxID=290339 RepID=A7MPK4_CROS8|nr:hypothetical protein ESA_00129 [Cronobacter sakazakii ATCC BAA-894]
MLFFLQATAFFIQTTLALIELPVALFQTSAPLVVARAAFIIIATVIRRLAAIRMVSLVDRFCYRVNGVVKDRIQAICQHVAAGKRKCGEKQSAKR